MIVWDNVLVGIAFTFFAALMGFAFMLFGVFMIPKIMDRLTPNINEEKEIVRGNLAVAKYFGSIAQAAILGMSIIIAAAIIAGFSG
jgi:hypothetical protein